MTAPSLGVVQNTVWCCSYPKSGNTWLRALLTAHASDGPLSINRLDGGNQPDTPGLMYHHLGLSSSAMAAHDIEPLQRLANRLSNTEAGAPVFRKVHDAYGPAADGVPRFLPEDTRLVTYIVRDPRAVAVSWAHHLNASHERAVEVMATGRPAGRGTSSWLSEQSAYALGSWSQHVESWLDQTELPVEVVRYEDLLADPAGQVRRVLDAAGVEVSEVRLAAAVEACSFDSLATQEVLGGFNEAPWPDRPFFRRGEADAWRRELDPGLAASIERDHGPVMERLGYLTGGLA